MNRAEIEVSILSLMAQEPVKMSSYSPQLSSDMFTGGRELIADCMLRMPPESIAKETVLSALRGVDPSFYSGVSNINKLFDVPTVFRDAVAQLLMRDLLDARSRDICRTIGYQLTYAADSSPNVYLEADNARMQLLLPQLGDKVRDTDSIFSDMLSSERQANTLKSYISPLDEFTGGFEPGDLVIIGGNGGMGKTSIALHMFIQNVLHDVPFGFYSLEMPDTQLIQRCCCMLLSIPNEDIKKGRCTPVQKAAINDLRIRLNSHRWFVNAKARSLREICASMRAKAAQGYKAFCVDYLQLVTVEGAKSREQEVATIARTLKDVAMETGTVVFALSQLSRENTKRAVTKPKLSDLRESGEIEQASDYVLFPYRPGYFANPDERDRGEEVLELIIAKGRSTGVGSVNCMWLGQFTQILH